MFEEYSQVFTEFLNVGLQEKVQQGSLIFSQAWDWVNANQMYIFCVIGGAVLGLVVSKMRKKQ